MLGWLFGKKKKKKKPIDQKDLYAYDELAAEFFAMWPTDQQTVLRALDVPKPQLTLDYAKPTTNVQTLATWKRDSQPPMSSQRFLEELHRYLDADCKIRAKAVFQQIFRDKEEVDEYLEVLEDLHEESR